MLFERATSDIVAHISLQRRSPFSSSHSAFPPGISPFFLARSLSARVLCSLAVICPLVRSRLILVPFSGDVVKYGLKRSLSIPPISLDYREIALPFSLPPYSSLLAPLIYSWRSRRALSRNDECRSAHNFRETPLHVVTRRTFVYFCVIALCVTTRYR